MLGGEDVVEEGLVEFVGGFVVFGFNVFVGVLFFLVGELEGFGFVWSIWDYELSGKLLVGCVMFVGYYEGFLIYYFVDDDGNVNYKVKDEELLLGREIYFVVYICE